MIATIGEALVDMIEQPDGRFQACLGGSVFNFTLGLARQGIATTYLNPLSTDTFGKKFTALLVDNGATVGCAQKSLLPTSLAMVTIDAQGSPDYMFYREAVADRDISTETLLDAFPSDLTLLHTGGLALVPDDMEKILAVIHAAKLRGALVSMDANLRPMVVKQRDEYIKGVRYAIRQAHIVKLSDEDLAVLGMGDANLDELTEILFDDSSVQLIAYTRGAQGASLLTRQHRVDLPAPRNLAVADTVGAGDCFHAGLIAYLHRQDILQAGRNMPILDPLLLQHALRHAIGSASLNIMRVGCDPANWDQIEQFNTALSRAGQE